MPSEQSGKIKDPKRAAELATEILNSRTGFGTFDDLLQSTIELCDGHEPENAEQVIARGDIPKGVNEDDVLYTREQIWRDMAAGLIGLSQGTEPTFAQERAIEMAPTFIEMIARQQDTLAAQNERFAKYAGNDDAYTSMVVFGEPDAMDEPSPSAKADTEVDYHRYKEHIQDAETHRGAAAHLRSETLRQFKELASLTNLNLAPVRER